MSTYRSVHAGILAVSVGLLLGACSDDGGVEGQPDGGADAPAGDAVLDGGGDGTAPSDAADGGEAGFADGDAADDGDAAPDALDDGTADDPGDDADALGDVPDEGDADAAADGSADAPVDAADGAGDAAADAPPETTDGTGGEVVTDCTFDGAFGFADGSVAVADVDAAEVTVLGTAETEGNEPVEAAAVHDCRVYAARGERGLSVVDASDPAAPTATTLSPDGKLVDVAVEGDLLAVAAFDVGAHLYDVSDPAASPTLVTTVDTPTPAERVAFDGDVLFVLDDIVKTVLASYDVSTPSEPEQLGEWTGGVNFHPEGMAHDAANDALLVTGGGCAMGEGGVACSQDLARLDTSGGELSETKRETFSEAQQAGMGPVATAPEGSAVLWWEGADARRLELVDRENLGRLGPALQVDWTAHGLATLGEHAYAAAGEDGLVVVTINPFADTANLVLAPEQPTLDGAPRAVSFR